jgi:predicted RNA binding protein YcfA (HicA-like mRNA interferase family)
MVSDQPTRKVVRELLDAGFRRTDAKGSHAMWIGPNGTPVSVPDGHRTISPGVSEDTQGDRGGPAEMSKTYHAQVTRDGRWWMVHIPELDELTQARRLSEVPRMAQEVIALQTDVPVESVEVEIEVALDDLRVTELARRVLDHRRQAAAMERQAIEEARELALALAEREVPVRDIGEILGVSYQRAHQLVEQ